MDKSKSTTRTNHELFVLIKPMIMSALRGYSLDAALRTIIKLVQDNERLKYEQAKGRDI